MRTKILVYDNQLAYYELLRAAFLNNYNFIIANLNKIESAINEVDMMFFFVYDEIELIDFVKIYREDIPVILGLSGDKIRENLLTQGNIHYLNLNKLKNELIDDISLILNQAKTKKII